MRQKMETLQQQIENNGTVIVVAKELVAGVDMLNRLANKYKAEKGVVGQDYPVNTVCVAKNALPVSIKGSNNDDVKNYREAVEEVVKCCSSVVAVVDSEQNFETYMDVVVESDCGGIVLVGADVFGKIAGKNESIRRTENNIEKLSNTFKGVSASHLVYLDENGQILGFN